MSMEGFVHSVGRGPPLVFLHGWTMDGGLFDGQLARLSDRFQCLAPDLPGHASARHMHADLDTAADHVQAIIDGGGLDGVVLIGWSMGAAAAWRMIARHGTGRLAGLVTVDMSPKLVNEDDWSLGLKGQTPAAVAANIARFRADWSGSAGAIAAGMFATRRGPQDFGFRQATAKIAANDPDAMNAMWASLTAMDERATIPQIDVPYIIAHGARSRVYPAAAADWLVGHAPNARKLTFASSGHSPHLEEPDAFAEMVAGFAETVSGRSTAA